MANGDGPGPYGAKGAGEGGILGLAAVIGSAVNQAAGVEIRDVPLTLERVWHAIDEQATRLHRAQELMLQAWSIAMGRSAHRRSSRDNRAEKNSEIR